MKSNAERLEALRAKISELDRRRAKLSGEKESLESSLRECSEKSLREFNVPIESLEEFSNQRKQLADKMLSEAEAKLGMA